MSHLQRSRAFTNFLIASPQEAPKHLARTDAEVGKGNRATMLFLIQREDGDAFAIAEDMDPQYARAFREALEAGVKVIAIKCRVQTENPRHSKRSYQDLIRSSFSNSP